MSYQGHAQGCYEWMVNERSVALLKGKEEPEFAVKVLRRRRSMTQNAYYWVLLGKLGQVLNIPKDELHFHMLKSYGTYDAFTVRADVPLSDYFRYWDEAGEGFLDGIRYVHIRAYKRSSQMDSSEFSKLLEGVVQECKQQGIETMTPLEIAHLEWIGETA